MISGYFLMILWLVSLSASVDTTLGSEFELSKREILCLTAYQNVFVIVDKRDQGGSAAIRATGTYFPNNIRTLGRLINRGATIAVIGGHLGLQAIQFAKKIGPSGHLIIFEPYKLSHQILTKNIHINQLQDITTISQLAIYNKQGTGYAFIYYNNTRNYQILHETSLILSPAFPDQAQTIWLSPLDLVIPKNLSIDFIFVTSHLELEVLEGMHQTIIANPNLIMAFLWRGSCLSDPLNYYTKAKHQLQWLIDQRYAIYKIDRVESAQSSQDSKTEQFVMMSIEDLLQVSKTLNERRDNIPVIFAPKHIDLNQLL